MAGIAKKLSEVKIAKLDRRFVASGEAYHRAARKAYSRAVRQESRHVSRTARLTGHE